MTNARLIAVIGFLITSNVGFVVWAFNDLKGSVRAIGDTAAQNSRVIATLLEQNSAQSHWLVLHEKRLDSAEARLDRMP